METFRQLASVLLVLALAVAAAYWLRRARNGGTLVRPWVRSANPARIRLIQRLPLTPQHAVCLLRIDEREVVVGLHPGGMTVLVENRAPARDLDQGLSA